MEKIKKGNKFTADIVTVGFALFAMFFGAGNLIFPPYLGWELGDHWFTGFICYLAVDIGFGFVAMLVIAASGKDSESITEKLGARLSPIFLGVICICIGPAIAIPRVASITYEVGIVPNFGEVNSILCTGVFFILAWILCISKSGVMDIVGKVLSPLMVAALFYMIVKGITSPIGEIVRESTAIQAVSIGISAGYQTMDMMAAVIFAITIIYTLNEKHYTEKKEHFIMILSGGSIATALLFIVYGGLAYIGATYSSTDGNLMQVEVLTNVVSILLGNSGLKLLGLIVALACLTTAIGLITSISEFFEEKLHVNYRILVTVFTVISFLISNLGTDIIINMASPILNIVYPVLITLTFCKIAGDRLPVKAYRYGAATAFLISVIQQIETFLKVEMISRILPLSGLGFGWMIPVVLGIAVGIFHNHISK
ncbi:MAG: branched-chain amino acid transport system II carrier protein [Anaerovoracaceae bacterium]|nr:branched-chain amino acid transport system II carrier protein [Anaerovoracaceae bacterium]